MSLRTLNPRLAQVVLPYVHAACKHGLIDQDHAMTLTGESAGELALGMLVAPPWPEEGRENLLRFVESIGPHSPEHIVDSNLTAFGLQPVDVRTDPSGWKWVRIRANLIAQLYCAPDDVIAAALRPWGVLTPSTAWFRTEASV